MIRKYEQLAVGMKPMGPGIEQLGPDIERLAVDKKLMLTVGKKMSDMLGGCIINNVL